ncbi:MAG: acyltransferase [Bacteroidaceae bacterium]|nr:acyltransferase [Bacteroidaceae bacterium]
MRNYSIDTLKALCAICVIYIHSPQIEELRHFTNPLIKCAVPIFFIISGYFTFGKNDIGATLRKRIISTLKIFGWGFAVYLLHIIVKYGFKPLGFVLNDILSVEYLIFNVVPYAAHLWYIMAYIYLLVIILGIEKFNLHRLLFGIAPLLLVTGLVFGTYSEMLLGCNTEIYITRNFLFTGLPYFTMGLFIKRMQGYIISRTGLCVAAVAGVISYLLGMAESSVPQLSNGDVYASTAILAPALLILFLNIKQTKDNLFSKMGREDSLYIYILHFLIVIVLMNKNCYTKPGFEYICAPLVFCTTLAIIYILRKLKIIGRII